MTTPAWANDHCTSPEQSKASGPFAPQMYGMPSRLSAARSMVRSTVEETRPPVTGTTEPAGALPELLDLVGQSGELGARRADHDRVARRESERPGDLVGDDGVNATDAD